MSILDIFVSKFEFILGFTWYYVVVFLALVTIVVFVHELGHFWVARRNGVKVEVFSIGFGPEILGWTDSLNTRWKIGSVPLGGYVKMFGEEADADSGEDAQALTPEEQDVSFHHKRLGQRVAIVFAGPAVNFIFAAVVLAVLFSVAGVRAPLAGVGSVSSGSAAEAAGLRLGDRIVEIDDTSITWFEELRRIVSESPGRPLSFLVRRGKETLTMTIIPDRVASDDGAEIGRLGVGYDPAQIEYERHNPLVASWMAVERTASLTAQILVYLGEVITGSRSTDELGGPIRIAQISGEMAQGGLVQWLYFMAALSVNLGLINLFPIPMLDGGHLAFYAAEAVRGRPLGARAQEYGMRLGLILVVLLVIFVTWKDVMRLSIF
jgi:regulator of sigma E protease